MKLIIDIDLVVEVGVELIDALNNLIVVVVGISSTTRQLALGCVELENQLMPLGVVLLSLSDLLML